MDYASLAAEALSLTLLLSLPALAVSLVIGLGVSVLQAVTQVQEQTLSFVPKLLAVAAVLALLGPRIGTELTQFTARVLTAIAEVG